MSKPPDGSVYVGDGVYAKVDSLGVWLCTFDGYSVTNRIYLEFEILQSILRLCQADNDNDNEDA